jgi:type IX secretion system PorP/SprF family membrane protein
MKKSIILSITAILFSFALKAQQLPLYSQYMMNAFLLNPGIAGSVDYFPIRLTYRSQWVGIDDAPKTMALSGNYLFEKQNFGLGGYIFNDEFGPMSRMGIQVCAAYHLRISNDIKLGIGLAGKAAQFKFDQSKLVAINPDDGAISYGTISQFSPDADFGMYLYSNKFSVGLAATQLLQLNLDKFYVDSTSDKNQIIRHYYVNGGYKFTLSDNFDLEPSVLVKGTMNTPWQVDFNVKAYIMKNYWLGVSYRSSKDIIAMIGVKYKKFYIGYAFDYTTSNIKNYSSGSHEILLGFNVFEGKNKGSSLL